MEHALSSTNPELETVRREIEFLKGWKVERILQSCIFGSLFLVRKQDGSIFKNLAVKAVTKKLAETGVCTNGSKVYENHELEVRLLKMVRRIFFSLFYISAFPLTRIPRKHRFETSLILIFYRLPMKISSKVKFIVMCL